MGMVFIIIDIYLLLAAHKRIGRVSNVTLCHEVPNFLFLFINFR